jgi:glucose/arabinose dehydrogenase
MRCLVIPFYLLFFCQACKKDDKTPATPVGLSDGVLTENLTHPWEIVWGPDDHIWMTERGGRVSRVNPQTGDVIPLITINDVKSQGEGGLLGMALHPAFSSTPQVFVAYNYDQTGSYREKVVRYTYDGHSLVNPVTILDNIAAANIHNGCRLLITGDKLFVSTGDAANQSLPQNTSSVNGKILRLNLDGSIPSDNPMAGNPVWSYGHRNAQGLVFANNLLYSSEHGPNSDDEINIIEKGRNYGWPDVKGFCDGGEQSFCSSHNVLEPLKAWTPTIAVSGMDYYDKDLLPQWKHSLLVTTLKNSRLMQLKLNGTHNAITETNEFFTNKYGRMRDVCISPDGKVYICTGNGNNDKIVEISKAE